MNNTIAMYIHKKHQFCYDYPVTDVYGALAAIAIWVIIYNIVGNIPAHMINVDKVRDGRIAELNNKNEDLEVELVVVSNQNEVLDEKLRLVTEQLRVARELNNSRTALLNNCHNAMNSFVSLFPPDHDTQG